MTDLDLVEAIKKEDRDAFESLFNKYYFQLLYYIKTHAREKELAKDIVQQTFMTIWKQRKELNISKSVKGYLYTLTYRFYVEHYRNLKRKNVFLTELREEALREAIYEDKELREKRINKLRRIIETLPPKCKEIIMLNKFNGMKYKEIAFKLGISEKTVESQMRVAFKKIREGFEKDGLILFFLRNFRSLLKPSE